MTESGLLKATRPATMEELCAVVRDAGTAGAQVRIGGSGSMPLTRFDAERAVQTVSMLRMNKVTEHAVGDMTVIVQAGITLEALQKQLAWQNQWLPVDPPVIGRDGRTPGMRTIGGLIATNSLGPLRFGCGDWRLFIMGMRWVDAEGKLIKGGGRTVKNVAGYSTPRMMIGSCGTLGVIAEVTLRTFARPADEKAVIFYCRDAAQAEALLAAVMISSTTPAYVQVIGGRTFAGNPLELPVGARGGVIVAIGFLGREELCAAQIERVRGLEPARGIESISQTAAQCGRLRLWMTTEPALPENHAGAGFRIQARPSRAAEIIERLEAQGPEGASTGWVVSEGGTGVVRGLMTGSTVVKSVTIATGGHSERVLWTQGQGGNSEHEMMKRIKRAVDPKDVLGGMGGAAP